MDFESLLRPKECGCGRTHTCPVERVVIRKGAISELGKLAEGYRCILLAADNNTYPVCGVAAERQLGGRLENLLVYETGGGVLIPNEEAVEKMRSLITENTDLIVGVGSGVIQDLCKYVSFISGLPYFIAATAPSMDGYASTVAAMIFNNVKVSYETHVPKVILGDVDVLKNAPMEMIVSGYGDILGKFSSLNDWKLSALVNGEYLCEYVYGMTREMLDKTKDLGEKLLARDEEAVRTLTEALVGVGIAMAFAGNSRPASGSEHHMSHFFEVLGIMNREPYFTHGVDVAYSALYIQKLREKLLKTDSPAQASEFNEAAWEKKIREIYGAAAEEVITLQKDAGTYQKDYIKIYREKWPEIKKVLSETPSAEEMSAYLSTVGMRIEDFEAEYGKEKLQNAVWYAKDLRNRYSVLWLHYALFFRE